MNTVIAWFIKEKLLMWLVVAALLVGSLLSVLHMRRERYPTVDFFQAKITTIYPGASPANVEQRVTIPIEDEIREVEGLKKVRSISRQSVSEINVQVDLKETDPGAVLDEVRRALDRVTDLPAEVTEKPIFAELKSGSFPILEFSVYGARDEIELNEEADFLANQIEKVAGVARVDVFGKRDREWHILINPSAMAQNSINLMDIGRAVQNQNVSIPGGVLEADAARNIRTTGEFERISELASLPVRSNETGNMLRLGEIARFADTYERPQLLARTNGQAAINLQVIKKERADILTLGDAVRTRMRELQRNSRLKSTIVLDESKPASRQLGVVINNAAIGLVLVVAILLAFLNSRLAIITALSLPLVVSATMLAFPVYDITFNMVSMMGMIIALGMLVDNSIVIAENVYRYREEGLPPVDAAVKGSTELVIPIIGSFLTTVAAFLPMMFMAGLMGKFIWQIPLMVIIVLTASLLESFFLLPARIAHYGGRVEASHRQNRLRAWINRNFEWHTAFFVRSVAWIVHRPFWGLGAIGLILVLSLAGMARMQFSLFPKEEVERFLIKMEFDPSFRIAQTMQSTAHMEELVRRLPASELVSYTLKGGIQQKDAGDPLQRVGEHLSMIQVFLTPEVERARKASAIIAELNEHQLEIPGLKTMQIEELVPSPPIGAAISVTIEGPEYETLRLISGQIQDFLRKTNGIINVTDDYKPGRTELVVRLKQDQARIVGIDTRTVAMIVRSAFEGSEVSTMRKGRKEVTLRVLYDGPYRSRSELLNSLPIPNRAGLNTRLDKISSIQSEQGPEALLHYNYERAITITADVKPEILTSNAANQLLFAAFANLESKHPGYALTLRGEQEDTNESMESLAQAGVLAIFAIFAILALIFNDLKTPFLILASIPLGLVGITIGFLLSGKALSFLAMIGIIGLAGVQVNASIMLVTFVRQLRAEGMERREALIQAARQRFRPILLTTLTTMGGLFPTAYSLGGSDPVLIPITLALAWGLAFGTFLTLLFIPASYASWFALTDWMKARLGTND
ncbi:MAG: efflux RND transporter permease subunit, partial [Leptospiraceae bacterium]|nr:efflux RND transporter permease subunit [Leptospiraceae bacterium]